MTLTAPTTATGSTLATVQRSQAGDYQRSLTTLGHRLPLGWDADGWRSRVAGYDLLLATPRTLSALGWFLMGGQDPELGRQVHQAHREAARVVALEFAAASGAEAPSLVGHGFDSARQPWLHATWSTARWRPPTTALCHWTAGGSRSRPTCTSSATTCWSARRSPS
jgi:hypothetical protein